MSNRLFNTLLSFFLFILLIAPFVVPLAANAASHDTTMSATSGLRALKAVERRSMPPVNIKQLLAEDQRQLSTPQTPGPYRFAVANEVNFSISNSGTWQDVPGGGRLWRLRVHSNEAMTLNFGFSRFELPEGARLWLYTPNRELIAGPYTRVNRAPNGEFWTPIISGDEVVIELFVPEGEEADVVIHRVNHGYRDMDGGPSGLDKQGSCNIDVICPAGNPWSNQIRSVARYTISGTGACTGTLLNNTNQDYTPYFLSAFHCGVNAGTASSLVFYWNFESINCGDLSGGSLADTQSGATYRSGWATSDFVLVELSADPDPDFNVFFSGWDASGSTPGSAVAIHHPSGDEKAISFENEAITTTDYLSDTVNTSEHHWRVADWNAGTTEPGSSGSCLWFPDNGLCVGQLHGGLAACGNDEPDWYGKFSSSWTGGGAANSRLRDWLNPANDGVTVINGTEPPAATGPVLRLQETLLDYGDVETGFAFTKAIVAYNDGDANLVVSAQNADPMDVDLAQWSTNELATDAIIPPGSNPLVLRQTYEPGAEAMHTIIMNVTSNDSGQPSQSVTLTGIGTSPTPIDSVLVLDRSGSMSETAGDRRKIDAMQSAVDLYTHLLRPEVGAGTGDALGFVKYNASNSVYLDLKLLDASHLSVAETSLSNAAIGDNARLLPTGATGIGGAIETAASEFTVPNVRRPVMVVLTDGIENQDPRINNVIGPVQSANVDLQMYSIGVGANIEPNKLQAITNVSNGYHQVSDDLSGVSLFDLETFYFKIFANAADMDLIVDPTFGINLLSPDSIIVDSAKVVSSDRHAVFLVLDDPALRSFYKLELLDPHGNVINLGSSVGGVPIHVQERGNYRIYRVVFPDLSQESTYVGYWRLQLTPQGNWSREEVKHALAESGIDYSEWINPFEGIVPIGYAAAVASNYRLRVQVSSTGPLPGAEITLQGSLSDRGWPATEGTITVEASTPGDVVHFLDLYDDGSHGDTEAGDGTWTNRFIATSDPGTYKFLYRSIGHNERGELAPREATRYVSLVSPQPQHEETECELCTYLRWIAIGVLLLLFCCFYQIWRRRIG